MVRLVLFAVLLVPVVTGIAGYLALGWWSALLVPAVLAFAGGFLAGPVVRRMIMLPFRVRGEVLRNAEVKVHSIHPATPPSLEEEPDTEVLDESERTFFLVDLTVGPRPLPPRAPTHTWDAAELIFHRPDQEVGAVLEGTEADDTCVVARLERFVDGQFVVEGDTEYQGRQRLRLLIGVRPPHTRLKLRYYFETLAEVSIPASMVPVPMRAPALPS